MSSFKKLPKNIKLSLSFLHNTDRLIRTLFTNILWDYCERFDTEPTEEKVVVVVAGISDTDGGFIGVTYEGNNRYAVHVYDPCLDQEEETISSHRLVVWSFVTALCHEFVHVAQLLTGRKPEPNSFVKDNEDPEEQYFFDPFEVEARILEGFYATKFGLPLRNHSESE